MMIFTNNIGPIREWVTIQYSEAPLVRCIIDPMTHWSEAPLFRPANEDYKVITC